MTLFPKKLSSQLFMVMGIVGLGPIVAFWWVLQSDLNKEVLWDARRQMDVQMAGLSERVAGFMGELKGDLRALQTEPRLRTADFFDNTLTAGSTDETLATTLGRLLEAYDKFTEIRLYDSDGYFIASSDPNSSAVTKDRSLYLKKAVEFGESVVSHPKRQRNTDGLNVEVYLPIKLENGRVERVIKANASFDAVDSMLDHAELKSRGNLLLINDLGTILYHPDPDKLLRKYKMPKGESFDDLQIDGAKHIVAIQSITAEASTVGMHWTMIGFMPHDEAKKLVTGTQRTLLWGLFAGIVAAGIFGWGISYVAQSRIRPLLDASRAVADQEWDKINVPVSGATEFREVSESFNQMVDKIRSYNSEMEQRIAEAVARMEATFQSTREALLVVDQNGDIQSINRRFTEIFGLIETDAQAMGSECLEALIRDRVEDPIGFNNFRAPLDTEESEIEWYIPAADSHLDERFLKVYHKVVKDKDNEAIADMWVFRDYSDERQLEQRLQQAQKMEAVGRLAGGIAHDFNNLLTSIIGNLSLLSIHVKPATKAALQLKSARTAAQRAADLVKQLLGFSRKSYLNLKHCHSNDLIQDVIELLQPGNDPTAIRISVDMEEDCWGVHVDPTQINQVLMNLCVNAKDALTDKGGGGDIILRSENRAVGNAEAVRYGGDGAEAGDYVLFEVRDTGTGIKPEILERIFEPFFTTKDQGKGTGLGLATSYGIVEQHGGWMICQSEVGVGTTFRIFLPRDEAVVEARDGTEVIGLDDGEVRGGSETILLVDDDPMVRQVSETFLDQHGYSIITASDGEEGLEVYHEHSARISCIVLDLTMPRLSGADTFKRLRDIHPDLPVIIYSGFLVEDEDFEAQNGSKPNAILCKPFALEDMANLIRQVLDESAASQSIAA